MIGGMNRLQRSAAALLSLSLIAGWAVYEMQRRRPLPRVDPKLIARFDRIVDSLNAVTSHAVTAADSPSRRTKHTAAPVRLNAATAKELEALPGIGRVLAERIVRYREEHGAFRTLEELRAVKGIGNAKLRRIAPYLRID